MRRDGQRRAEENEEKKRGRSWSTKRIYKTNIPHEQASIHERNDPFIYF